VHHSSLCSGKSIFCASLTAQRKGSKNFLHLHTQRVSLVASFRRPQKERQSFEAAARPFGRRVRHPNCISRGFGRRRDCRLRIVGGQRESRVSRRVRKLRRGKPDGGTRCLRGWGSACSFWERHRESFCLGKDNQVLVEEWAEVWSKSGRRLTEGAWDRRGCCASVDSSKCDADALEIWHGACKSRR
jgi:hypothetical protein